MQKTTSTLASANGRFAPSNVRNVASVRVRAAYSSDSVQVDPDPAHLRVGRAEHVERVAGAAAEVDDERAGPAAQHDRHEVLGLHLGGRAGRDGGGQEPAQVSSGHAAIGHGAPR